MTEDAGIEAHERIEEKGDIEGVPDVEGREY